MKQERNGLQVLEREVESAQRVYEAIQARQSQMGLESNNNQNNISILQPATEPAKHTYPKVFLNLMLAFSIGSLFAIIFVLLAEMFDIDRPATTQRVNRYRSTARITLNGGRTVQKANSVTIGAWSDGFPQPRTCLCTTWDLAFSFKSGVTHIWSSRRPRSDVSQSCAR